MVLPYVLLIMYSSSRQLWTFNNLYWLFWSSSSFGCGKSVLRIEPEINFSVRLQANGKKWNDFFVTCCVLPQFVSWFLSFLYELFSFLHHFMISLTFYDIFEFYIRAQFFFDGKNCWIKVYWLSHCYTRAVHLP